MDIQLLKEQIINENKIEIILQELGMHHIKETEKYFTCGMPDGNNPKSTVIYKNTLIVEAYTRDIKDKYGHSDLISLVTFVKGCYFTEAIKWICDVCGYDYYSEPNNISKLKLWINKIYNMSSEQDEDENTSVIPLDEKVLSYFGRYVNPLFRGDNISNKTMYEFELGYDLCTHAITIPIRDELGTLVGVKARLYKNKIEPHESKYFYIYSCPKNKILYGLYKTMPYIKRKNTVYVVESEKGVMQLWSYGIKNAVAISGHKLSKTQVQKLTHLNVNNIVIAYDEGAEIGKDGKIDKNFYQNEFNKFLKQQTVYCLYDKNKNVLNPKESPTDSFDKWNYMIKNCCYKVRG